MGIGLAPNDIIRHDIEIPQAPDLLAEPAGLVVQPRQFRAPQHRGEEGEGASQSTQCYPQLVWSFRIVQLLYGDHVGGDLIEALANDIARRLLGRLRRVERNRFRVPWCDWRLDLPCLGEQIA